MNVSEFLGQTSSIPLTDQLKSLVDSVQHLKPEQIQKLIEFIDTLKIQD
jgi:hypothetical protein